MKKMQNHWNSLEAFYDTIASLLIVSFLKYSNKCTITTEICLK